IWRLLRHVWKQASLFRPLKSIIVFRLLTFVMAMSKTSNPVRLSNPLKFLIFVPEAIKLLSDFKDSSGLKSSIPVLDRFKYSRAANGARGPRSVMGACTIDSRLRV